MITVAPMDRHGNFSFGLTNGCTQEMLDAAETIIVEVNPNMPVVFGMGSDHIHVSKVHAIVESQEAVSLAPNREPSAIDKQIAENIFPTCTTALPCSSVSAACPMPWVSSLPNRT